MLAEVKYFVDFGNKSHKEAGNSGKALPRDFPRVGMKARLRLESIVRVMTRGRPVLMSHLFDPGYGAEPFRTLCAEYPDISVYSCPDLSTHWSTGAEEDSRWLGRG